MSATKSLYEYTTSKEIVELQEGVIADNKSSRGQWEEDCRSVMYAYRGNKFPVRLATRADGGTTNLTNSVKKAKDKKGYVNLIKRQYRVMANYLLNNEPQYLLTKKEGGVQDGYLQEVREALNLVFDYGDDDDMGFYDTVMDETIFYGIHRGIAWTMVYFDETEKQYRFKTYDSMDTYIDLDVNRLSEIRKFITTYNRPKSVLQHEYKTQHFGEEIKWDEVTPDKEESLSDTKQSTLPQFDGKDSFIIREGYYIDFAEDGEEWLYRIITTKTLCLKVEKIAQMKSIPVTWFSPLGEPGEKYPRSWFADLLEIEREVNELIQKMSTIIKTGGRYVYVRTGTKLTKSTSNFLNSLGIEVIEVAGNQELPQQANLLQISQSDIQFLDILLRQGEEEGGMKSDIMGTSSTGSGASGRAIQALQAGSKNNIGTALNELNKYMTRLTRIMVRMFAIFPTAEYFSEEKNEMLEVSEDYNKKVKIKVSITGRDAFDEVTQILNAIDILKLIKDFNPEIQLPPKVITKLMGVTNEMVDEIEDEIDKQADPDLQIAEGQLKKLLQGIPVNASESDNHQVFMAVFSEGLKAVPPDSPAAQAIMDAIRVHEAFIQTNPNSPNGPKQA